MSTRCRVCLTEEAVFDWNTILCDGDDLTYEDVFYHCTQFERTFVNELNKICAKCKNEILIIYNFIKKARISLLEILSMLNNEGIDEVEFHDDQYENIKTLSDEGDNLFSKVSQTEIMPIEFDELNFEETGKSIVDEDCEEEYVFENLKQQVGEISEHVCEYCGKCLSSKITKARHIKSMHSNCSVVLCEECPRIFKDTSRLRKHRRTHDENRERKYACQYCELKFFTRSNCRAHEGTHEPERVKKFECDQCEKAFLYLGALKVHKRIHTGEMHQCSVCDKQYARAIDLQLHMRSHTNEKPFQCDNCEKSFTSSSALSHHFRNKHLGFKHKCYVCTKCFENSELLNQHVSEHHNTFPFVCAICSVAFVKRFFLHRHLKLIHNLTDKAEIKENVVECMS